VPGRSSRTDPSVLAVTSSCGPAATIGPVPASGRAFSKNAATCRTGPVSVAWVSMRTTAASAVKPRAPSTKRASFSRSKTCAAPSFHTVTRSAVRAKSRSSRGSAKGASRLAGGRG